MFEIKEVISNKRDFLKEKWVTLVSFFIALFLHILIISLATHHYLGSPLHPERANQTVQKLEEAIKKKNMRFVYINDDPSIKSPLKPSPDAPLSDKDRKGGSPDGRKGKSWDPYSLGSSPTRQYGSSITLPNKTIIPNRNVKNGEEKQPSKMVKEAEKKVKGIDKKEAEKGIYAKGELSGTEKENHKEEIGKSGIGSSSQFPSSLSSQLSKMYVDSLKGGFRNTNASRLNEGAVSFETSGWDLGPYARVVQEKVQSNWRIPGVQEVLRQKGWVAIQFDILKDGNIANVEIIKSSRIPSYDQAAVNALKSSSPLPPLPSFVDKDKITGVFRFFYYMWSEEENKE